MAAFVGRSDETAVAWSQAAAGDLHAIYRILAEHHPGPLDDRNPQFGRWHDAGLRVALEEARQVGTYEGYYFVLRRYIAGFRDNHLNVSPMHNLRTTWPGFVVRWRSNRVVVCEREGDQRSEPPKGARLVNCDGRSPEELMKMAIFSYFGNPDLESSWIEWGPWLLVDLGNPWMNRPRQCTFEADGRQLTCDLTWQPVDIRTIQPKLEQCGFGPPPNLGVRSFNHEGVWISLSTFNPKQSVETEILSEIVAQASQWRNMRVIVFDVRGNRGGNSQWGEFILERLFGREYFQWRVAALHRPEIYDEWRVSEENQLYLRKWLEQLEQNWPVDSNIVKMVRTVADDMGRLQRAGIRLCPYREQLSDNQIGEIPPQSPVTSQIFLLTDGRCGSACLDFADLLFAMSGVRHVGLQTSADSSYGDVRGVTLPSGLARLTFAMKVHRNRPRGHNQPYDPDIAWDGDIADTAGLEQWIGAMSGA
jgi:hypothetical protein